jgi:hypothetical protein
MWTGDTAQYINNHAPVGLLLSLTLTSGVRMQPLNLLAQFNDFEGDTLKLESITGTSPPGTAIANGVLFGTPTGPSSAGSFALTVSDLAGDRGVAQINWTIAGVDVEAGSATEEQRLKTRVNGALTQG